MIYANTKKDDKVQLEGTETELIVDMFFTISSVLKIIKNERVKEEVLKDLRGIAEDGNIERYFKTKKRQKNMQIVHINAANLAEALKILENAELPKEVKERAKSAIKDFVKNN